jgi:hypothetical protein
VHLLGAVALALAAGGCGEDPSPATSVSAETVLSVGDFMRKHKTARAPRTVEGLVGTVAPKEGIVGLTDCAQDERCVGEACCDTLTLPVKWTGALPTVGQRVRIVGTIEEQAGGRVFVATRATVTDTPRPGD